MITDRDAEFITTIRYYYDLELGRLPDPGGLASWLDQCRHGMTGPQLQQALHDSPEGVAYRARPRWPLPQFAPQGIDFVDASGQRMVLRGVDQFCAYRQWLSTASDLTPLVTESHDLGFDTWRVFLMGSVAQNGVLDLRPEEPGYYESLRPFASWLNSQGIVLLATVFVDAQDVMPDAGDRRQHWTRVANELRGTTTMLSGGNEWSKNGFNPGELTDPGMLWSRGSDVGDIAPYPSVGSVMEFHPRRDLPAAKMDTVASPVYIYANRTPVPLLIDEPPRMGTNGSGAEYAQPRLCYEFARYYSTGCACAVFHNYFGQRGLLMDEPTRACATAWQRGMRL